MRVMYYQAPTTTKIATNIPRLFLFKLPSLTGKRLSITCYERSNIVNDSEFANVQHILTSPTIYICVRQLQLSQLYRCISKNAISLFNLRLRFVAVYTSIEFSSISFKRIGFSSCILLNICSNCIPLAVVAYVLCPSSNSIKSFCSRSLKYSFSCAKDRKALYIIFVLVALPPLVASRIDPTMSVLLLYFIII
jgi:hypothetical protein